MGDAALTNRWPMALAISLVFFGALTAMLLSFPIPATLMPVGQDTVSALGTALLDPNQYLLPFEIASVLLLAALIGAVFVANGKQ